MILSGEYYEKYIGRDVFYEPQEFTRIRDKWSVSKADRSFYHKILAIVKGPVYTLFVTWGKHEPWYYMVDEEKIESTKYREMKNTTGFK